jgi:hypothetical protein
MTENLKWSPQEENRRSMSWMKSVLHHASFRTSTDYAARASQNIQFYARVSGKHSGGDLLNCLSGRNRLSSFRFSKHFLHHGASPFSGGSGFLRTAILKIGVDACSAHLGRFGDGRCRLTPIRTGCTAATASSGYYQSMLRARFHAFSIVSV